MLIKDIKVRGDGPFSEDLGTTLVPGDKNAYRVVYQTPYDLTGTTLQVTAQREDGAVIQDTGITQEKTAYYVLKNNLYVVPGDLHLRLTIVTQDETILTQKEIILPVAQHFEEPNLEADDRTPALSNLITQTMQASSSAKLNGDYAKEQGDYAGEQGLAAENAAGYAQEKADEVAAKLAAGEFIGPKGETGPQGPKGEKGDKGDKGDPGNMVTVTDNLTSTSTTAALSANQGRVLKTAVDGKADKQNAAGGFAAGNGATAGTGAAIGKNASANAGGAFGEGAAAGDGFAGGNYALTLDMNMKPIDAIQLGEGQNTKPRSLQAYWYQLMDENGKIPMERLAPNAPYSPYLVQNDHMVQNATSATFYVTLDNDKFTYYYDGMLVLFCPEDDGYQPFLSINNETPIRLGRMDSLGRMSAKGKKVNILGGQMYLLLYWYDMFWAINVTQPVWEDILDKPQITTQTDGVNAIQLGNSTNVNSTPNTLQVYDYPLLDANGKIPPERLQAGGGGSGGGKYASVVIGTSAAGYAAGQVDYLCDGTADDVQINQAIQSLTNGGKIVLLEGTYNLAGPVNFGNCANIILEGMGKGTVLKRNWNSTVYEGNLNFVNTGSNQTKNIVIQDLIIDCNEGPMLNEEYCNLGLHLNKNIKNCRFVNLDIINCVSQGAIFTDKVEDNVFSNISIEGDVDLKAGFNHNKIENYKGTYINTTAAEPINENSFIKCEIDHPTICGNYNVLEKFDLAYQLLVTGDNNTIQNCTAINVSNDNAIMIEGDGNNISNNSCSGTIYASGINVTGNDNIIAQNYSCNIMGASDGIRVSGNYNVLMGNICNQNDEGITVSGIGNTITGNTCTDNAYHDFHLFPGEKNLVTGNSFFSANGSAVTIDEGCTNCFVSNNVFALAPELNDTSGTTEVVNNKILS